MALSGWKALLKIGGCSHCWKELQVPWSPWFSSRLSFGWTGTKPHISHSLGGKGLSAV